MPGFRSRPSAWAVCVWFALLTACTRPAPRLDIGAKDGMEHRILGEILAAHLSKQLPGVQIVKRFGLGNSALAHSALLSGDISMYPEYSGTALFNLLKMSPDRGDDPLLDQLREAYRTQFRCEWFGPLGFRDARVFVVPRRIAEKRKLRNLSDASTNQEGWALGGSREFRDRPDGMVLLTRRYEFQLSAPAQVLDDDAIFLQLAKNEITMGVTRATDPRLDNPDFVQLPDDQKVFPIYEAGFVVKLETLEAQPALAGALKQLYGKITLERMRVMVRRAEKEQADPAALAAGFLKEVGL